MNEATEGCAIACIALATGGLVYFAITFGISYAIAHLVVSLGFVTTSTPKLALLIWLVRTLLFHPDMNYVERMQK